MIPKHVGIIMDGNGRWAKKRQLPRTAGHAEGVSVVREVIRRSAERGVRYLTLFAFAKLNWNRPPEEVERIFELIAEVTDLEVMQIHEQNVRFAILGDTERIPQKTRVALKNAVKVTSGNTGLVVSVAVNYDGREAIAIAANQAARIAANQTISVESIEHSLNSRDLAPLDMIIRTGGEHRLSGFMTWEAAFAEIFFTDTLWPDFTAADYDQLLDAFANRERRFGRTSEQLPALSQEDAPESLINHSSSDLVELEPPKPNTVTRPSPSPDISLDELLASEDSVIQSFCETHGIRCVYFPFDRTRRHAANVLGEQASAVDRMVFIIKKQLEMIGQCYDLGLRTVIILTTTLSTIRRGESYTSPLVEATKRFLYGEPVALEFYAKYAPRVLLTGPKDIWETGFGAPIIDKLFTQVRDATARNTKHTLVLLHSDGVADSLSLGRPDCATIDLDEAIEHHYGGPVDPVDFSIFGGAPQEYALPPALWNRSLRCMTAQSQLALGRDQLIRAIYAAALSRGLSGDELSDSGSYADDTELCRRLHNLCMLD